MRNIVGLLGVFAFLLWTPKADASVMYLLNVDGCTGTCGIAPFGQVLLDQTTPKLVTVTVTLKSGEAFVKTGAGDALEFNVAGPLTIGSVTAGFKIGPAPDTASAFGSFLESVTCKICQGGHETNPAGPLSFTVTSVAGVKIADFIANDKHFFFASDILGTNGGTGNVAANGPPVDAPEPVSMALIGFGLVAIGVLCRRISRQHS